MRAAATLLAVVATVAASPSPAHAVQLDQPTDVQVVPGRRAIAVTWDAPPAQDPPNPVDHYVATTFPDGKICESATLGCTINGLQAGVSYEVEVVACPTADDFDDCSEPSTRSATVIPGPPGIPAAPTVAYTGTGGQVAVSWTDPGSVGAGIESFRVTSTPIVASPTGSCAALVLEAAANTCVLGNLTAGISYTFKVISNGIGTTGSSAASGASAAIVAGPPGTIAAPTVARVADDTVRVTWTTPVGGGPVANYSVLSNHQGDLTVPGTCEDGSGDRTCDVDVADPAQSYTFQVRANGLVNGASSGTSTSATSGAITPGAPNAPGTPGVEVTGVDEVTVTWAASTGGGTVTNYTVQSNHQGDMTVPSTCEDDAADVSCVVTGLDPELSYVFQVTAVGPHGNAQSAASPSVIPDEPGAPGTPAVDLTGPGTATVTWTAPTTGGPVTGYVLTADDPSAVIPGTCGDDPDVRTCDITGLNLAIGYTFQVKAIGELGDEDSLSTGVIFPDQPGVPGTPAVDVTGAGTATVTWTAPSTGGPVTSYVLTSSDPDAVIPGTCGDDPAVRSCAITGLDPELASTFQVKAVGQLGDEDSAVSTAIFHDVPGVPGTPAVSLTGPGTATVTWTAPTTGGPVASYVLTASDPSAVIPGTCGDDPDVRSCDITGLDAEIGYTFEVKAVGDFGDEDSLSTAVIFPDEPGVPGTPAVDVTGSGTATVTWTAPTTGGPVTSYVLTSSDPDAVIPGTCGDDPDVRSCAITGLDPELASTFQVKAVGQLGDEDSAVSSAIFHDEPGVPGTPAVDVTGVGTATVTWTAPTTGGPVTGYVLTSSDPDAVIPGTCGDDPDVRTCDVTDLDPELASTFQVKAIGDFGDADSAASTAIFHDEPGVPGTPAVDVTGAGTATVTWTAPTTGGPVTSYVLTSSDPDAVIPGTCGDNPAIRSCAITGLDPELASTFQVKAIGDFGDADSAASTAIFHDEPGVPGTPAVSLTGPGTATVTWTAPTTGGPVAGYVLTADDPSAVIPGTCGDDPNVRSCDITGLDAEIGYTFEVKAVGDFGDEDSLSTAVIFPDEPGVPGTPAVDVTGPGAATVTWTAPTTGGPVTSYVLTSSDPDAVIPADCGDDPAVRSCAITGLDTELASTFRVKAVGQLGDEDSLPSTAVVPDQPGVPGTPAVDVTGVGTATVTWTAPLTGGPVTSYVLTSSDPDAVIPGTCGDNPAIRSCAITGLDPELASTFQVKAIGDFGDEDSLPSTAIFHDVPGVPGTPAVDVTGAGTATVTWTAPTTGGPVTGYVLTSSDPDAVIPGTCGDDPDVRTCDVTGLDPELSSTFQVKAIGDFGDADSAASTAIFPDEPGVPGTPAVNLTGPGAATVTWTAPTTGGPVASYELTASDPSAVIPGTCGDNPAVRSCAITGLDPAIGYTFRVKAVGDFGDADSVATAVIFPDEPGVPGTPAVNVTGPGAATVTWTAPTSGGPVTSYVLTSNDPSAVIPGTCGDNPAVRSCAVTGLDPAVAYTFRVQAIGQLGDEVSAASPAVTPDEPGVPGTPSVVLSEPNTATVRWTEPTTGGPVTSYTLTSNQGSLVIPADCGDDPAIRECVIEGLNPALSYTFRVRANGPLGDELSAASTAVTPDEPGLPGTPTVVLSEPNTATVSWTEPTTGGPVTSYTLTSNQGSLVVPADCGDDPSVRSCALENLNPALSYTFRIRANGPLGDNLSAASTAVRPDEPGVPGTPDVENGVAGSVTVSWQAPTSGGPVTGYSVTSLPEVTPPAGCTRQNVLTCVFTGLDPTRSYTFLVTAHGPLGDTNSASSAPITPGAPGAPGTPTVSVTGPNTVRVTWTASPAGGGPVTGYTVTSDPVVTPPAGCTLTTQLACNFTGLDATKSYTFLVTANGPSGNTPSVARSASISTSSPGAPGTPTVQVISANTVKVSWTAPTGGGPLTNYTVTSLPAAGPPAACVNVTALTCNFSGLTEGTGYTFLVTANGPAGSTPSAERSASISTGGPGTPGMPTVVLGGPHAVKVSWTAPVNGGPVVGYSVVSDPALDAPAQCTDVLTLSCTFGGLASGTAYTFRVVATGPLGGSSTSAPSAQIIPGPPDAPERPTVASTGAVDQVRVSWVAPSAGAGIAGYTVQSNPGRFECAVPAGPDDTSCVVSGLNPATSYTFRVQAVGVTGSGNSAFSPASEAIVPQAPGRPTDVDVVGGDRQIAVSWTPPANAGQVAHYRATASPGGAFCTTDDNTSTECVITGVTNLTSYTVTVVAAGNNGIPSAPSAPSVRVRPTAGPPGAPTAVRATPGDGSALISWTAPVSTGDGISRYTATATGNSGVHQCLTPNGSTLSCTIDGLANLQEYTVTVVSIGRGASGNSPRSTPIAVTPVIAPAAPTDVVVTAGTANLTVNFTPGDEGSGALGYTATATGGPSAGPCTVTTAATPCIISGVQPGTTYTVRVVANSVVQGVTSAPSGPAEVRALSWAAPQLPTTVPSTSLISGSLVSSAGTSVRIGSTTTITGNAYAPFTGITVGMYPVSGAPVVLATTVTDSTGAFSVQVTIPDTGIGARTILAAGMRATSPTTGTVRYKSVRVTVAAPVTATAQTARRLTVSGVQR